MSNVDTSADAVERLAAASNDHADDCESNAETHDDIGICAHAAVFREMANHHLDTAATLRAILAERDALRAQVGAMALEVSAIADSNRAAQGYLDEARAALAASCRARAEMETE